MNSHVFRYTNQGRFCSARSSLNHRLSARVTENQERPPVGRALFKHSRPHARRVRLGNLRTTLTSCIVLRDPGVDQRGSARNPVIQCASTVAAVGARTLTSHPCNNRRISRIVAYNITAFVNFQSVQLATCLQFTPSESIRLLYPWPRNRDRD